MVPSIRTNSPWASLVPTFQIILLGMLWELVAELRRRDNDKKFNKSMINKLHKKDETNSKFEEMEVFAESL